MIIESLHIISFGGLRDCDIDLAHGVNVLAGANESGKSSAAMFIKFIFYGLSAKVTKASGASERQRYINRTTGQAAGYLLVQTADGTPYRLERAIITSDDAPPRERVRIINRTTGETITGVEPGEHFFGVPAEVFVNTCFLGQSAAAKPEVSGLGQTKVGGAVENLLTTADESVDIKQAVTRLDGIRRELLHKNKNGGAISDLKEQRGALLAELSSATDKASELLTVSTSLDDIKRRIASLEEAGERYTGMFAALDKILVKRRIDAAAQTEERIAAYERAQAELDASPLGDGFVDTLTASEHDIRTYDELCTAYDAETDPADAVDDELPETAEVIEQIRHTDASARTQLAVAIAMLIAGVIGLGAAFLLYYFNTDLYVLPLVMTLILITLGIVFMAKHAKTRRILLDDLDEWGAETIDDLELAVEDKMTALGQRHSDAMERRRLEEAIDAAKLRFDAAQQQILSLADAAELTHTGDLYATIDTLHAVADGIRTKRASMQEKVLQLTGRLEVLREQLDGIDIAQAELEAYTVLETADGKAAAALSNDAIKTAAKERDFTENALKSARKRQSALEERLAELGKLTRTPDVLTTMIAAADARIDELTLRHDACTMAEEAIRRAGEHLRAGVLPRIAEDASALLSAATPHDTVLLDAAFTPSVGQGADLLPAAHLSRGTADLAYIALRIALADEIFRAEEPILILDESFAHIDADRTRRALAALPAGQYLIFTCRHAEADAAASLGYHTVSLD